MTVTIVLETRDKVTCKQLQSISLCNALLKIVTIKSVLSKPMSCQNSPVDDLHQKY